MPYSRLRDQNYYAFFRKINKLRKVEELRKIIHVDMDAFYASVEQLDYPELRGKPVIVGGSPDGRGVVATASYEARKYGIHSAMSAAKAKRLCPHAIFVRSHFGRYKEISQTIRTLFREVTPLVEPLSLDEAYLDVSSNHLDMPLARDVAIYLKSEIKKRTGLTASAGVGPNKFIAKVASDLRKPDGLVVVAPSQVDAFVKELPLRKLWGVGPATAKRLQAMGFKTVGDLRRWSKEQIIIRMGKHGAFLWELAHGRDRRKVNPTRIAKSRGAERTFGKDILDIEKLNKIIKKEVQGIAESLKKMEKPGKTITLKVRYSDFTTITRSKTLSHYTDDPNKIYDTATALMKLETEAGKRPVRLIGVSVSHLYREEDHPQLELF